MIQKKLTPGKLLDGYGSLTESGYATSLVKKYNRNDVTASKKRIKEWDYYFVSNNEHAVCFTIADLYYYGFCSITLIDYKAKVAITNTSSVFYPKGRLNLPSTSEEGTTVFKNKRCDIKIITKENGKVISGYFTKFDRKLDLTFDIDLTKTTQDSIVMATPFDNKYQFYYNQKINLFKALGRVNIAGIVYKFNYDAYATLDWGRGVWPRNCNWYWGSMNCDMDGVRCGFNLGYGFGNNDNATENMLYYKDKGYKIEQITFKIPKKANGKDDYMNDWLVTSNDKVLELKFTPIVNRSSKTNLLLVKTVQNQVFGRYNGYITIEGKRIEIVNKIGFAEKVYNKW